MGWPLFMAIIILISTIWGLVTGEWKGSGAQAKKYMLLGLAVLMVASGLVGLANRM